MRPLIIPALFLIALSVLLLVDVLARAFFLYWRLPLLDVPMHLLGGVVVALGMHSLRVFRLPLPRPLFTLAPTLAAVLIVGLVWESFELFTGTRFVVEARATLDTATDLIFDVVGGALGFFIATRLSGNEGETKQ